MTANNSQNAYATFDMTYGYLSVDYTVYYQIIYELQSSSARVCNSNYNTKNSLNICYFYQRHPVLPNLTIVFKEGNITVPYYFL